MSASTRSAVRPPRASRSYITTSVIRTIWSTPSSIIERERVLGFHRPALESLSSWDDIQRWRDMVVEAQAARACRGGCPLGSLASELADLDEPARARLSDAFMAWERLLSDGLAQMVEAGSLRGDADARDLALSVLASLQGGLLLAEIDRSTASPRSRSRCRDRLLAVLRPEYRAERPIAPQPRAAGQHHDLARSFRGDPLVAADRGGSAEQTDRHPVGALRPDLQVGEPCQR